MPARRDGGRHLLLHPDWRFGSENRAKADDSAWRCPADALLPARLRPYLHVHRHHPGDVRRFRLGRSGVGGD